MRYDYLIVGSGFFGSTFAFEMKKAGKTCLVIEKRDHIGGNSYTEKRDNINLHIYGAHIFHTNDKNIWDWINQFSDFNNYQHRLKVNFKDKIYSFPINLLSISQIWEDINSPEKAIRKLRELSKDENESPNLEDYILGKVGKEIYEIFIKGYTTKQWNRDPKDLPSSIIKRIPIRTNFNDNYFADKFQGIPTDGYTKIFEKILDGIEVRLNTDYFENREYYNSIANKIVFTGKIDQFFDFRFGELEYRSLRFDHERVEIEDYQGCSVMNYTDIEIPFTRICEHKHFENSKSDVTWITKEYPKDCTPIDIPYYPVNDEENMVIYHKYKELSKSVPNVIFGGRLAEYRYYDMHQIIGSALVKAKSELKK